MDATLLNYVCLVCTGCYSPSSGVPVYAAKVRVFLVASQCGTVSTKFFQCGLPVQAKIAKVSPVAFQCGAVSTKFFQ